MAQVQFVDVDLDFFIPIVCLEKNGICVRHYIYLLNLGYMLFCQYLFVKSWL